MNCAAAPGQPRSFLLTAHNSSSLTASWENPNILNGVLLGYELRLFTLRISSSPVDAVNVSSTVNQYMWTNLQPYFYYEVSVAAFTSAGRGARAVERLQMPEAGNSCGTKRGIRLYTLQCMF